MKRKKELYFSNDVLIFPLLILLVMVIVFWIESRFAINFNYLGIYPRTLSGLRGIVFGPFIHSNVKHLFSNSIPILVLTTALFYFYRNIRWKVLVYGLLLTGFFTWLIGRPSLHIGASGVVYMLTSFLIFKGIFTKQYQLTAVSFVVIFLYGSIIWSVFPTDPKISWEGHLSGFLVGLALALLFNKSPIKNKKYQWEKDDYNPEEDPFLQHFDEDGNFIETPIEIEDIIPTEKITINYTITKKEDSSKNDL